MNNFFLIMVGVLLNAVAQLLLKKGMMIIGEVSLDWNSFVSLAFKAGTNIYIVVGLISYVISFMVWLIVLSKVEVSYAYPFLSIGYIVAAVVGYFFFGESMGLFKICGIAAICFGVILMFQS